MPENKGVDVLWNPRLPVFSSTPKTEKENAGHTSSMWMPDKKLLDGLFVPPKDPKKINKLHRKQLKDTVGKKWFDMAAPTVTPEVKKDLEILKLRGVIDPKRHYKKNDSKELPKYFQVGTVVESATEFFSSRLTRRQRKTTLTDELLSNPTFHQYRKRKVAEIEDERHSASGVSKWRAKKKMHKPRKSKDDYREAIQSQAVAKLLALRGVMLALDADQEDWSEFGKLLEDCKHYAVSPHYLVWVGRDANKAARRLAHQPHLVANQAH